MFLNNNLISALLYSLSKLTFISRFLKERMYIYVYVYKENWIYQRSINNKQYNCDSWKNRHNIKHTSTENGHCSIIRKNTKI